MVKRLKASVTILALIAYTTLLIVFDVTHDMHAYTSQIGYIAIVLFALWQRRWLFYALGFMVGAHIVVDWIAVGTFPVDAFLESLMLVAIALVLYYVTSMRHEATTRLEHSNNLMKYIIHHNNAAVAVHDRDLKYVYVSQAYLKQYRVSDEDIIGKHHYEVFPDLPQKWRDVHQKALKGESSSHPRDPFPRADGRVDYTRWECIPWYQEDGEIGGFIVYTEVINEQLEIEKKLEESRDELLRLMENLPIGIAVHSRDESMSFSYMNDNFPRIFGTTKDTLMQTNLWDVMFDASNESHRELMKTIQRDMKSESQERMRWLDIPITVNGKKTYVSMYSSSNLAGDELITTVIDVTEQKLREDEIKAMSYQDFVTGVPNRQYFSDRFFEFDDAKAYPIGMLLVDINGLKLINDAFGFSAGTQALRQVAAAISDASGDKGVFARVGSDEFALLMPHTTDEAIESMKATIYQNVQAIAFDQIELSISIGTAKKSDAEKTIGEIYKIAEEDMLKRKVLETQSSRSRAIEAILATLTDKHVVEKVHSERVADISRDIGEALNLNAESVRELRMAGMLHDIGKIATPDNLLSKPSQLTDSEWPIMKEHTLHGYNILRAADEYSGLAVYALTHHEYYDGSGYPKGLKGEDIPLFSRIIAVADAFEAMTANRPYRKALTHAAALKELKRHAGTQFDPHVLDAFERSVYPSLKPIET